MAAITTAQAGNWDQTATWTGGVIPVSGDTVTLNHAVTVTDTRTVGHSPAAADATNAIRCNAALTIAAAGVLICRGDIGLNNVSLILQAGAILEFDASAAGTPSTARYVCKGINSTDPAAILTITGTSGSRCTVRSNSGGANGRFDHNGNDNSGQVQAEYCDFVRIGDSSNPAFDFILGSGRFFLLTNCTFDSDCGQIGDQADTGAYDGGARIELLNVTHRGGAGSNSVGISSVARSGSGTRRMEGCVWAKAVVLFVAGGWTISDTLFQSTYDVSGSSAWATFLRNLIALPQAVIGDMAAHGDVTDCYLLRVGAPTNQHGFKSNDQTGDIDGCIFDMPDGTNGAGDCITFDNPSFSKTTFVRRCIVLPTESGVITGTLLSCLGGANQNVRAEHNTYLSGTSSAGIYVGESYAGHAGMLTVVKSNLAWSPSANSALVIASESGIVQDVVLSANVTHNGKRNPANGGTGYDADLSFSSGTPGANDVTGDPQFVDATRNIKTWSTSLGGAGTVTDALTELAKKNDGSGYDASYTIADLITYVREGFAPQNAAFDAGHDGDTIGAVPLAATTTAAIGIASETDTALSITASGGSAGWTASRSITINAGMITGTLTDFPVLVAGTYAYLATVANGGLVQHASGHDVAFFDDDPRLNPSATQLKHEIEKWTAATGEVAYWVKVPSAAVGTVFYIAYGNASISTDQSDAVNVWDANFVGVWHLKDGTTLSALNSVTGAGGTINGPVAAAGSIDGAASFDGVDDNIDFGDIHDLTGAFTISCRCRTSDISIFLQMLVSKYNQSDTTTLAYYLTLINTGADCFVRGFLSTDGTLANTKLTDGVTPAANDVWINPALVFSGVTTDALQVFLNGVDDSGTPGANATGTATNRTSKLVFGARQAGAGFARFFKGLLDEVRISNVARSAAWLAAEFNNQDDPAAFYTVGQLVNLGQASETDTALAIVPSKSAAIGQASETDTALSITPSKSQTLGIAEETDTALPITRGLIVALGQATETDTAQSITASKSRAIGIAEETDAALSVAPAKSAALGQAEETDTAQSITPSKAGAIGLAEETDSALPITLLVAGQIGQASELDTALPIVPSKARAIGLAEETDSALSITHTIGGEVGQATETDTALSITPSKARAIGIATETSTALSISPMKAVGLGVALETDEAFAMVASKSRTIGLANEIDTALAMTASGGAPLIVFGPTRMVGIFITRPGMSGISVSRSRMIGITVEPEG